MRCLLLGPLLAACAPPGPGPHPTPDTDPPARVDIVAFSLACDLDAERWTLEVEADAWTGGGVLFWSVGLDLVERHAVRSVRAAPDGDRDDLLLVLPIVGDWREATPDVSTAIRCRQDPSYLFALRDASGAISACERGGPDPEGLLALPGAPACP